MPQILMAVAWGYHHHWHARDFLLGGEPLSYLCGLFVGLGWIGVVMLICQRTRRLAPVAAVGRMALTNYLMQSLICTSIFYGHGLGNLVVSTALASWQSPLACAIQLILSSWWFTGFSVGPVEWAWRSAASGRRLPLRS